MSSLNCRNYEMDYQDFIRKLKLTKYAYLYGGISKIGLPVLLFPDNKHLFNYKEFTYLIKFMKYNLK